MEDSKGQVGFEDKKTTFFWTELVAPCDMNDPDKSYFNDKLQEIDSLYFPLDNFKILSRHLK